MTGNTVQKQKSFLERAILLTGANLLAFMLSFITPLVIVRMFSQSEFGTYKQLFQILTTFMTVLYLQVPSSAYYFMPREPNKRLQVAMNIIIFYVALGLGVVVGCARFPEWITYVFHNPALNEHIPLLGWALMLWLIATNVEVFPLVMGDVRTASVFIILSQISKSLILIGAAVLYGNLRAMLWGSIFQGLIQCAFMVGYIHFRIGSLAVRPDKLFDWRLLKKQLANSLPYGGGSMMQSIQVDLHNYFVSHYFSAAAFAVYANGCFQMPLLSLLQTSFRDALTPDIARMEASGDYRAIIHSWLSAMRKLAFAIMPACGLMFVLRYELITTLFTKAYADSVPIFSIYLISMLSQMVLTTSVMRAIPDFRFFRLKFNLVQIPLTGFALYIGIQLAGLIGAVTATVSIYVLDVVICVTTIYIKLRVTRRDLKTLAPVLGTVPAVLAAMTVTAAIKTWVPFARPIMTLGVCAVLFGVIYLIAAIFFGALTADDKAELYRRLRHLSEKFMFRILQTKGRAKRAASMYRAKNESQQLITVRNLPMRRMDSDFNPETKARAVLQFLMGARSATEICIELQIDGRLLSQWKEQFLERASLIFEDESPGKAQFERVAELERLVGRLMLELESTKKVSALIAAPARRNGKSS
jgi:O-antigen/teichoic acid export membrane protein/transposase-like protein